MSFAHSLLWASVIGGASALLIERKQNGTFTAPAAQAYQGQGQWVSKPLPASGLGPYGHFHSMHSQAGQDWLVQSILNCPRHGYFVELAAARAEVYSNSLTLERDFQWDGLCIDANPSYMEQYARRKCQFVLAAVGSPTDTEVMFDGSNEVEGGIVGPDMDNKKATGAARKMKLVGLADILRHFQAPKTIDYFSLDVEGAESIVMHGFPWAEYKFKVITIERPKADLETALSANGYEKLRTNANFGDSTWINTHLMGNELGRVKATLINHPSLGPHFTYTCMTHGGYPRPRTLVDL